MHTTPFIFYPLLISSDRPTDATTKAKFIMQISRGFPEKVNTIIAVLAELTKAMYEYLYYPYTCIVMLWYLIRIAYSLNRILSRKFIENHLHVVYVIDLYPLFCTHNEFMFNSKVLYKQCKLHHTTI